MLIPAEAAPWLRRPRNGEVHLWHDSLHYQGPAAELELENLTTAERSSRLGANLASAAGRRFVLARAALRRVLGAYLGIAPRAVPIERAACRACGCGHGKPMLPTDAALHFNVSHCRDLIVIAVAAQPVGVDVEPTARAGELWRCRDLVLAHAECVDDPRALLRVWTQKEAMLKQSGFGLSIPPAEVAVRPAGAGLAWAEHPATGRLATMTADLSARHHVAVALAVRPTLVGLGRPPDDDRRWEEGPHGLDHRP